jgi:acetolactate synthase-1/2/3 large subunit
MDDRAALQGSMAESLLRSLRRRGIEHVFANAGTDFAPLIEALTRLTRADESLPRFITVPHENLAVAMAHGYYRLCGRPAAVMVHVTVGTANTICNLMNAYRDNVPLLLLAGRTPITQAGHIASRSLPIHWGQENFDQAGMVREYTKWDFELRAGQSADEVLGRALEVAMAEPRGPIYLTLPREVLASPAGPRAPAPQPGIHAAAQPSRAHIDELAAWVREAEWPMVVTSHLGRDLRAVEDLAALADAYAIPVAQPNASCVNLPASHPMNTGQRGAELLEKADLIIVVDSEVPWFPARFEPRPGAKVAHLGPDPLWVRYPIRVFPSDLVVPGASGPALRALAEALDGARQPDGREQRRRAVKAYRERVAAAAERALESSRSAKPIAYDYLAACIKEQLPEDALVVTELGVAGDSLGLEAPGSLLGVGIAGGLGFGLGAALGAKLAAPGRAVIATVGDGSYMFGNPTPFHFVSRAANLPVLTIICNNGRWQAVEDATLGVYPDGVAAASETMPLVELAPSPDFSKVAEASGAFAQRVEEPRHLPGALNEALAALRAGRQALLDVRTARR